MTYLTAVVGTRLSDESFNSPQIWTAEIHRRFGFCPVRQVRDPDFKDLRARESKKVAFIAPREDSRTRPVRQVSIRRPRAADVPRACDSGTETLGWQNVERALGCLHAER